MRVSRSHKVSTTFPTNTLQGRMDGIPKRYSQPESKLAQKTRFSILKRSSTTGVHASVRGLVLITSLLGPEVESAREDDTGSCRNFNREVRYKAAPFEVRKSFRLRLGSSNTDIASKSSRVTVFPSYFSLEPELLSPVFPVNWSSHGRR